MFCIIPPKLNPAELEDVVREDGAALEEGGNTFLVEAATVDDGLGLTAAATVADDFEPIVAIGRLTVDETLVVTPFAATVGIACRFTGCDADGSNTLGRFKDRAAVEVSDFAEVTASGLPFEADWLADVPFVALTLGTAALPAGLAVVEPFAAFLVFSAARSTMAFTTTLVSSVPRFARMVKAFESFVDSRVVVVSPFN
jgi:hypothetical protein